ncbi:LacI family DNA-binding transcriptional regulator [Massilia sp. YIM B04103]|uniref:LacI family DNA-binding transcriptional regulator n=1 Tax=Massilia sp. YIM B04103 TaxID=2963106 RepID=UPI00210B9C33|nr:LacI family DNA-binding transcriptional regulator [Massilia sp. YIM B04103]
MTKTKPPQALSAADQKAAILREDRRVTSYDVAMLAGVSQSAVSRCFKPGASVSKATYARVMQAAEGLGYIPNAAARSLITRRSNTVALLISNASNLYYPEALSELSQQITRHGKRALLFTMQSESDVGEILNDVWQYQVDGVIAAAALSEAQIAECERRRVPLVVFNRHLRDSHVASVFCDQYEAGRMLAARLAAAGHRQFGIIAGPEESTVASERRRGATEKLLELGLPAPALAYGCFDYGSGAHGLRQIIAQLGGAPDAIICGNDVMALGCLDHARHELRLDVPGDLSVAGFDAVEPSNWLSYNLTTLRQPIQKMALAAADLLAGLIDAPCGSAEKRVFAPQLIEGATARLTPRPTALAA